MTMRMPDWTTLNAYVDGELDAAAAAAVADAAGRDRAIADQIAALYKLRGVARQAAPEAPPDLADLMPARRRISPAALAASLAAAVLVGVALWMALASMRAPVLPSDLLATAQSLHDKWLSTDAHGPADAPPTVLLAALTRFGQVPVVPDLESSELSIALVTVAGGPDGRVLQVGYRGNHGCHLSMFVFADSRMPRSRASIAIGAERAYGWRVGDLGYLLFAIGMDENRLALIANTVEQATRAHAPLDAAARQQLAANKRLSATCHA